MAFSPVQSAHCRMTGSLSSLYLELALSLTRHHIISQQAGRERREAEQGQLHM